MFRLLDIRCKSFAVQWLCLLVCSIAFGCSAKQDGSGAAPPAGKKGTGPIAVVCTTGMVADLVREIGGDHVQVVQLMGEGVDPHIYKASPADLRALGRADAIVYSGLHLEGKLAQVLERMGESKPVLAIASGLPKDRLLATGGESFDPHCWMDVSLWSLTVKPIADFLTKQMPEKGEEFATRAEALEKRLAELDKSIREQLEEIPPARRVLVTAHDAFRYFGKSYNVEVRGLQGVSTESEAGVKQVNDLVRFLVDRQIKAVFVETSISEQNMHALLEGCRSQKHELKIGGELYSDALGKAGTAEGTYEGMIRHNVATIVQALK